MVVNSENPVKKREHKIAASACQLRFQYQHQIQTNYLFKIRERYKTKFK